MHSNFTPTVIDIKVEALTFFEPADGESLLSITELRRFDRPAFTTGLPLAKPRNEHALPDLHPLMRAIRTDVTGFHVHYEGGYPVGIDVRPAELDLLGEGTQIPRATIVRRLRLPARFLADIAEHSQYIQDHRLSGGIHIRVFPWSREAQARMTDMGRIWSRASEISRSKTDTLQFSVTEQASHTATRGGQETVGTRTRGSNFGGSVIFLSGGGSESRTRPDRKEAANWSDADTTGTSRTFGGSQAQGTTSKEIDVILTGRLKRASELAAAPPERQPLEVEIALTGGLVSVADQLLSRYQDTTEVAPFHRLIERDTAYRSLRALDRVIGFRTAVTPAMRPPDGSGCLQLRGTNKTVLQAPGELATVTGPPGSGKTFLDWLMSTRLDADIKIVLDAEKSPEEQHLYREAGFRIETPATLRDRDGQLLGMSPAERRAQRDILKHIVPGGGMLGSALYDAFVPDRDLGIDSLAQRITELNTTVRTRTQADGGEVYEAIRERLRMFESDACDVAHLIREDGHPIFTPGTRMVICLRDLTRQEQCLFVLATLVALNRLGLCTTEPTLLILDEMKRVFGGSERERVPQAETEDTSVQLLDDYLQDLVRAGRQRQITVFYTEHTLADIPAAVRDRAKYHVFLPRSHSAEIELFAKECGLQDTHLERLTQHVFSTYHKHVDEPRLCLVGGARIRAVYGQPYVTCLIPGVRK